MDNSKDLKVIVKRVRIAKKGGHHGGSWKIAYADFVTAMMAFFLIMWILSMLNKSQLQSVATYFKAPKKYGLEKEGSRVNKANQEDFFLEKGKEKSTWKDINKEKEKKKEDEKIKTSLNTPENKLSQNATGLDKMREMKRELEEKIAKDPAMEQYKNHLNFVITSEGLKIELRDLEDKPMFSTGKTDFEKYASVILNWLGHELNTYPNQLVIIGHTDSAQYPTENYSNWELSADRANATRRALLKNGMGTDKILRVIGEADRVRLNKKDGLDSSNRRIDIIVLTNDAAGKISNQ